MVYLLFSKRDLFTIIAPLMIEQLLAVTIGMLDTVMVSSAGEAAISGVSLVDTVNILLVYLFSALSAGGSVVISQAIGKGDIKAANASAKQLIWVVFSVAFLITAVVVIFRKPFLGAIFGSVDADVMKNALVYFLFTALSYPFLGVYNSCAAIFRSMGNSKISMIASIVMNLINFFGNALLIFGFHMGAAGAAIATLFSRIVGAAYLMFLLRNPDNMISVRNVFNYKPNFLIIKNICRIGIPNGLENGMFQFGKVLTQSLIATFGTAQIAANAVGSAITTFQYVPGAAIGMASITIVGRCIGAQEKQQAKKYALKLVGITYCSIFVISLISCAFVKPIVGMYSVSAESALIAIQIIISHSIMASLMHPFAFTLTHSFRAASDVKYSMVVAILSMWIFRVGLSYVLAKYFSMGVMCVWLSMYCDWIIRTAFYATRYFRGTWLTKYKPIEI